MTIDNSKLTQHLIISKSLIDSFKANKKKPKLNFNQTIPRLLRGQYTPIKFQVVSFKQFIFTY